MLHLRQGVFPIFKKVLRQESQAWVTETLTTLAAPLTFFLAFGLGLKDYIADVDGLPYILFISPGLIMLTILNEAYRTGAWGLWLDRWHQKMLNEYRIKPITTSDIIIGEILGGFTVAMIKGAMVAGVLLLLAPLTYRLDHVLLYLLYVFPGCILFTCIGTLVGTLFRKPDHIAQIQSIIITPLLYLGGLFFPINAFPEWLQPLVMWLPTAALFEGGRMALLRGEFHTEMLLILWVSGLVSFVLATRVFNRKLSE
jgi:lipooligosaccharide transport system permease protein